MNWTQFMKFMEKNFPSKIAHTLAFPTMQAKVDYMCTYVLP